ncbi:MAG TPA: dienelactone hydrolase family protein [Alphaproteobacteria bacterium]|nr:dienelactone hydrolase family protein [Alphaproteobacteria bacterium]
MGFITVPSKDGGSFSAWLAEPAVMPAPAVIVIQEIFGVNADVRHKCDELAAKGFLAFAPDLFWRLEPGVDLTDQTEQEWKKAMDLLQRFDIDKGIDDLRATLHTACGHAHCTGKVGAIGYCLGGRLAYLMATRTKVDCAVGYYGVGIERYLEESVSIRKPLMLHIAREDEYVPPGAQQALHSSLERISLVTLYDYPGAKHAFARAKGVNFDAQAASSADSRSLAFLRTHLGAA